MRNMTIGVQQLRKIECLKSKQLRMKMSVATCWDKETGTFHLEGTQELILHSDQRNKGLKV